jgi:hypothetical protein
MMGAFQVSVSSIQAQNGPSLLSATAGDRVEAQAPTVGTKVRFFDRYKPPQVPCWGCHWCHRDRGALRTEFWVGLLGPRSLRRLHHAMDRGVAIGAGKLSSTGHRVRPSLRRVNSARHEVRCARPSLAELMKRQAPLGFSLPSPSPGCLGSSP